MNISIFLNFMKLSDLDGSKHNDGKQIIEIPFHCDN